MTGKNSIFKQEAVIAGKIITIRDEQVLLDIHLAELYEVETRALKQAVRRNIYRFPPDFIFELTDDEIISVVSQNVIPSKKYFGGSIPFAFTENGVAMLSSVLKSKKAIEVNIAIMRTFTILRKMLLLNKDVMLEVNKIKQLVENQENNIEIIFEYLRKFEEIRQHELEQKIRKTIGYKRKGE
jgi:hypothetical protein